MTRIYTQLFLADSANKNRALNVRINKGSTLGTMAAVLICD